MWYNTHVPKGLQTIKDKIALERGYLHKTYGVSEIGLFGSVVRGEDTPLSDVDMLFVIEDAKKDTISLFDLVDMKTYLERVLGRTVDIVEKGSIKPQLKERIMGEVVMV